MPMNLSLFSRKATAAARGTLACAVAWSLSFAPLASAQFRSTSPYKQGTDPGQIGPVKPTSNVLIRPYQAANSPAVRLSNSERLRSLIRGNILYLSVQDAIALAIENNIDLEVDRYNAIATVWAIQRAEAGGAARGVTTGNGTSSAGVASGQGVIGSQQAAGINTAGGSKSSINNNNASISQIGPITQVLDPIFSDTTVFSHVTTPLNNVIQSGEQLALVDGRRNYSATLQQGYLLGGNASVSYTQSYLNEAADSNSLNPSLSGGLSLSVTQNLLQGFGNAVNARSITVAKANIQVSDLNFRAAIINVVSNVLSGYYQLVTDLEDFSAKRSAVTLAQQLLNDNKRQVDIGTLAPIEITRAEAQVASAEQDLTVSETTLLQQEVALKNLLSRNGLADPQLATVRVVPIDKIVIPDHDDLPPLKDLIAKAVNTRTDIKTNVINFGSSQINALGTHNGVLPTLQVLGGLTGSGLVGTPYPPAVAIGFPPAPSVVGGVGKELGQIFRGDYASERIGVLYSENIHNYTAQADANIDQLQLRQSELSNARDRNQVAVLVSNSVIGLQQAHVQYRAAVKNRVLQDQLLEAEQKKFRLGTSTPYLVITQQRDLANAKSTEVAAEATYAAAKITLDQVLGTTLETFNISVEDARVGRLKRESVLPPDLPNPDSVKPPSAQ